MTLVPRDLLGSSFELPRGFALRAFTPPEVYLQIRMMPRAVFPPAVFLETSRKTKRGANRFLTLGARCALFVF